MILGCGGAGSPRFRVWAVSSRTVSLARAARLAGLSRLEFQRIWRSGEPLPHDSEDLNEDIATLKRLGQLQEDRASSSYDSPPPDYCPRPR